MARTKTNVTRVNYSITPETKDYIQTQAYEMGITASAFITVCVDNFKTQRRAMEMMKDMSSITKRLDKLSQEIKRSNNK